MSNRGGAGISLQNIKAEHGATKDSSMDAWVREYEDAKQLADDALAIIQERNLKHPNGGQEASRVTAVARRKLGSLATAIDAMRDALDSPAASSISANEKNRRRDLVNALRARREQMLHSLKRDQHTASRVALMEEGRSAGAGAETLRTADLDGRGILQLQEAAMAQQDAELEQLERSVASTKHIALAVNEELGLHARLLDELDEDVEGTHSRMRAAQKRLKGVLGRSGNCGSLCLTIGLMVALAVLLVVAFKLASLF